MLVQRIYISETGSRQFETRSCQLENANWGINSTQYLAALQYWKIKSIPIIHHFLR